jgi:orotidine-5'-phosphate decarboxylase
VLAHCRAVIDATADACVAVKLQLARFELLGGDGWSALEAVGAHARRAGLLVIADGKRGDIDVTAPVCYCSCAPPTGAPRTSRT